MAYDVVVVGAGLGGLTVAALLSARGMSVCLLERQSQVGGCIARVVFGGYEFEPGCGVYTSFGPGKIYERLFSQLPVDAPQTTRIDEPYVVRLADGSDVRLWPGEKLSDEVQEAFINAGIGAFLHPTTDRRRSELYEIDGGTATLAERLAESIKRSGGVVRLNASVLRLAYDQSGVAIGVDLLSGEQVVARRAIVSNLTIWDTYGKLIGLNRTPLEIKKQLNKLQGAGAFVVYASIEDAAIKRLPAKRMLVEDVTLAVQANAATLMCLTDVNDWFGYHSSEEEFEESDQAALEQFWTKLHRAMPELGGDIEVIETANPRTYYELTRRKLGMVMGVEGSTFDTRTSLPNVFLVGDTVSAPSLDRVAEHALGVADMIKPK
jgi:phytoene dehydrogenase-like protein